MNTFLSYFLVISIFCRMGAAAVTPNYDDTTSTANEKTTQQTEGSVDEEALFTDGPALPAPPNIVKKDIGNSSDVGLFDNTNADETTKTPNSSNKSSTP